MLDCPSMRCSLASSLYSGLACMAPRWIAARISSINERSEGSWSG